MPAGRVYVIVAAAGPAAVPVAFTVVRTIGAAYLVCSGVRAVRLRGRAVVGAAVPGGAVAGRAVPCEGGGTIMVLGAADATAARTPA